MEIIIKIEVKDALKLLTGKMPSIEPVEKLVSIALEEPLTPKVRKSTVGKIKQVPWSKEEKAWLKKQPKPCKANGRYQKTLKTLFGNHRTIKSIDGCWRRLQRK
jgi:hypothetical protein